jgi:hypothetical protein
MANHWSWGLLGPGIFLALLTAAFVVHLLVISPCRTTTDWHTVTTSVGTYRTTYKDNSEWCLWVRSW